MPRFTKSLIPDRPRGTQTLGGTFFGQLAKQMRERCDQDFVAHVWKPQRRADGTEGAQEKLLKLLELPADRWVDDIFFGGARGGGKTDGVLGHWLHYQARYGWRAWGVLFRRSYNELEEVQKRAMLLFPQVGAVYAVSKRTWLFPNDATLKMRYLKADGDADKYQGHQYCVAVGTPVLMADGSWRPIESVQIGELVATLEGPRQVTTRVEPYTAPCVRMRVAYAGDVVAEQVHPVWHPVCGAAGWLAWSTGDRSGCRGSEDARRVRPLPRGSSCRVVLHARGLRSSLEPPDTHGVARLCRSLGRSVRWSWSSVRDWLLERIGLQPHGVRGRSSPQIVGPESTSAPACGRHEKRGGQGSVACCPTGAGSGDALVPVEGGSDRGQPPTRADAEARRRGSREGDEEPTPTRSLLGRGKWEHPYTGEVRDLSEEVLVGEAEAVECGNAWVTDLTVEDVNHYITFGGLVNKNTWMGFDELTNWASREPVDKLRACLRSPYGIPVVNIASGNPGGKGHNWVKNRYVDPSPPGEVFDAEEKALDEVALTRRIYIPATLEDNPTLLKNDPMYWQRVVTAASGREWLLKAWRWGEWDITAGGMFDDLWRKEKHVVQPFRWPDTWRFDRSMDWGSSRPFSIGWWVEVTDDQMVHVRGNKPERFPVGTLFRVAEWYGWTGKPNDGIRMAGVDVGRGIMMREAEWQRNLGWPRADAGPADPSMFSRDGAPSHADELAMGGATFLPAQRRVGSVNAKGPRQTGWEIGRRMLLAARDNRPEPQLYICANCTQFIRTVPSLPRDTRDIDDVDTEAEDHVADEWRYRLMGANMEFTTTEVYT